MDRTTGRKLAAECLGTFCLVFVGTGAIVTNETTHGSVSQVGVALTFGLIVLAMIHSLGDISGAHLNPAVTLGFFVAGRISAGLVVLFAASQFVGAVVASLMLHLLFPASATLGRTAPSGPAVQSFVLEVVITLILMFVILSVSSGPRERGITAGLVVGGYITLAALFAGPISGASMNPARSAGPALVSGDFTSLWIYLTAPLLGAALAVPFWRFLHDSGSSQGESSVA